MACRATVRPSGYLGYHSRCCERETTSPRFAQAYLFPTRNEISRFSTHVATQFTSTQYRFDVDSVPCTAKVPGACDGLLQSARVIDWYASIAEAPASVTKQQVCRAQSGETSNESFFMGQQSD
jgi:hypothetical protein